MSDERRRDTGDLSFNPFDPSQTQHMWGLMERLRSECPVSRPMEGFVYTSTYADTAATFKDAKRFSSAEGFRGAGVVVPDEESFLGEIDPPLHPRVRRLLHRAFTPRTALEVEPFTRELTEELLAPIVANGGGDLMVGLCTVLPVAVSAEALGIPREQHAEVAHWCQELLHSTWPEKNETERGVGVGGGFPEFAEIIDAQIRLRRESADPPDDLLTRMVQAEDNGDRLTDLHIRTLTVNTLAGSLSTTYMLGNLLYRFAADPSFAETLRADRDAHPGSGRGVAAARAAGAVPVPHGEGGHDDRRHAGARGRAGHHRHRVGQPRRAGVRVPGRVPPRPRDHEGRRARPPHLRRRARTSASASTSRGWKGGWCSRRCSTASRPAQVTLADDYELQLRARCSSSTAPRRWT